MKEDIKEYILKDLLSGNEEISTNEDLLSSGIIDSLGAMQLINFIENRFDIKIPPEDMVIENFISIDAMGEYIENRKT